MVSRLTARVVFAAVVLIAVCWASSASGLVSSNDGSHVALARALVLRGETSIDPDIGLTLWVDRAHRKGRNYSDRPPGTAFAALPAVRVGALLDPAWYDETRTRIEAGADAANVDALVVVRPATDRYIATYGKRRLQLAATTPNLIALQGTAAALAVHTAVIGALGLCGVVLLLRRRGVGPPGQLFAALALGLGTLWGPYSTMLFSHVTAATAVVLMLLGLDAMTHASSAQRRAVFGGLAGLAGAWAIATDYALLIVVVPLIVIDLPPRHWIPIALGALPIVGLTFAYHDAAFGSPLSIGYDHQTNFDFARERTATFGGDPLRGAWTLFGFGRGAGVLALSPIVVVGLGGVALLGRRRWLLALLPWAALLCFHRTPWGGAGEDHRYLIPALGPAAVGLGLLWQRFATAGDRRAAVYGAIFVLLAVGSAALVWAHFFAWRG